MIQHIKFSLEKIDAERLAKEIAEKSKYYANVVHWSLIFALPLFWLIDYSFKPSDWTILFAGRVMISFFAYLIFLYWTANKDWWGVNLTMSLILGLYTFLNSVVCALVGVSFAMPFFLVFSIYFLILNIVMFWKPLFALIQTGIAYVVIFAAFSVFNKYDSYNSLISNGGGVFFILSLFSCLIAFNRFQLGKRELSKNILIDLANDKLLEQNEKILSQQNEIKETNRRLQKLNEYRSDTMNIMMHDFRNFTGSIQMSVEMLKMSDSNLNDDQKEIVNLIGMGNEKIKYLSEKLSSSAETFATEIEFNFERINFSKMVEMAVFEITDAAMMKMISIQLNIDPSEMTLFLDRIFLEQTLSNLFLSVIRHSSSKSIITVHLHKLDNKAVLDIANKGKLIGIQNLENIFSELDKASKVHQIKETDEGMGLSIAKKLTEQMHGSLNYDSNEAVGNFYRLEFNLAE